jgi:hypothetical protein
MIRKGPLFLDLRHAHWLRSRFNRRSRIGQFGSQAFGLDVEKVDPAPEFCQFADRFLGPTQAFSARFAVANPLFP